MNNSRMLELRNDIMVHMNKYRYLESELNLNPQACFQFIILLLITQKQKYYKLKTSKIRMYAVLNEIMSNEQKEMNITGVKGTVTRSAKTTIILFKINI